MPEMPIHILIGLLLLWAVYVTPTVIAFRRHHPNRWVIAVLNIVFGATLLGWLAALVWAMQAVHLSAKHGGSDGGESGLNLFVNDVQPVRIVRDDPPISSDGPEDAAIDMQAAVAELDRLKKLLRDGILTQQQFEALKAMLLRRVV